MSDRSRTIPRLKKFVLSNQLMEYDLSQVEEKYGVDLGLEGSKSEAASITNDYYSQIESSYRIEAKRMAPYYEMFYSLEKSIRNLISETLSEAEGANWWKSERVADDIRKNVADAQQKERQSGITPRSTHEIDFCTFGELNKLIEKSWDLFGAIFSDPRALNKVMYNLNTLRNSIAHCSLLADDEMLRLRLAVRDWFRLMD